MAKKTFSEKQAVTFGPGEIPETPTTQTGPNNAGDKRGAGEMSRPKQGDSDQPVPGQPRAPAADAATYDGGSGSEHDGGEHKRPKQGDSDEPVPGQSMKPEGFHVNADDIEATEDLVSLFDGKDLSEDFKTKAADLFRTLVAARVNEAVDLIVAKVNEEVIPEVAKIQEERLEGYLDTIVDQWMENNEVALESGAAVQNARVMLAKIAGLFEEHSVEIAAGDETAVEQLQDRVDELEESLNFSMNKLVETRKELEVTQRSKALDEASKGLTQMQAGKLKQLSEAVKFEDPNKFTQKLTELKETFTDRRAPKTPEQPLSDGDSRVSTIAEGDGLGPHADVIPEGFKATIGTLGRYFGRQG